MQRNKGRIIVEGAGQRKTDAVGRGDVLRQAHGKRAVILVPRISLSGQSGLLYCCRQVDCVQVGRKLLGSGLDL